MRTAALAILVFASGSATSVGISGASANAPQQAWHHELTSNSTTTKVWVIFDPLNCQITTQTVQRLNALHAAGVVVEGVFLNPPASDAELERLAVAFDAEFPIRADAGDLFESIQSYQLPNPMLVVTRPRELVMVASLGTAGSLGERAVTAALWPSNME